MSNPFTPACTPEVQRQRNMLFSLAAHRIGKLPSKSGDGQTLDRVGISRYLSTVGCPVVFDKPLALVAIAESNVRTAVDEAAQHGYFKDYMGMAVYPTSSSTRAIAAEYAAVACSEFLRRNRSIAWRSADAIVAAAPRRVINDEDDEMINEEFFTLTNVYELLVISAVQASGHTEYEERMLIKVLNERQAMFVPTIVVLSPSVGHFEVDSAPIAQYLLNNFLTVSV